MSRITKKLAAKKAAYDEVMRQQPAAKSRQQKLSQDRKKSTARWVRHEWVDACDKVITRALPARWPDPGKRWHRDGSLDEIEQRENAGQRSLF